jgi:HD-GYP domain-containing protein (c-di-GMP phosphodiesterase class II)
MITNKTETTIQRASDDPEEWRITCGTAQADVNEKRLDLLYEVGKKASSASEVSKMIAEIVAMTRQALKASASSVLLIDEDSQELFFEFADGTAGGVLKKVRLSLQSGIAGWVARNGKPLIVNDVSQDERFFGDLDKATGFTTRSIMCTPLASRGEVIGVVEVLNKLDGSDFNDQDLETLTAVASIAAIAIENSKLHQLVIDGYKGTIKALAAVIDAKDPYTRGHSQRVVKYVLMGGASLSFSHNELEILEYAGILHDIGKIAIDDRLLSKPGLLTEGESRAFHEHPAIGARIIHGIPFLDDVRDIVLHHHERYDGAGYPDRLKGDAIPLGARLLAVADTFDSMTTNRPYHAALSIEQAIAELRRCTGTQFCPVAADAFISGFQKSANFPGCRSSNDDAM